MVQRIKDIKLKRSHVAAMLRGFGVIKGNKKPGAPLAEVLGPRAGARFLFNACLVFPAFPNANCEAKNKDIKLMRSHAAEMLRGFGIIGEPRFFGRNLRISFW